MSSETNEMQEEISAILTVMNAAGLSSKTLPLRLLQPTVTYNNVKQYLASLSHEERAILFYSAGMLSVANSQSSSNEQTQPNPTSTSPPVSNNGNNRGLNLLRKESPAA